MEKDLGERVKAYRRRAGMTLQELADKTDLSPSFLSKLESGKVGVSVANLDKISSSMGIYVSHLVDGDGNPEIPMVTKNERRPVVTLEGGTLYEALGPMSADFTIVGNRVTAQPDQTSGDDTEHLGDEMRYILEGRFRFWVGDDSYDLEAGDVLSHPSTIPHRWKNIGDEEGVFIVFGTMPSR